MSATSERIILAWEDWSPYGEGFAPWNLPGIRYRMFDLDGGALADFAIDRLANTTTDAVQVEPSVAVLADGAFLIAWSDASEAAPLSDGYEIRARRFAATGDPVSADATSDFVVNLGNMAYEQYEPTTAPIEAPEPGFLLAWTSLEDDGRLTVRANFVPAAGGVVAAAETILPFADAGDQYAASAAADTSDPASTEVAVVWVADPGPPWSPAPDDFATAIGGVRLAVDCAACAPAVLSTADTLLNTTFAEVQETPSAAFGSNGALALVWTDWSGADGSGGLNEVRARYLPAGWVVE